MTLANLFGSYSEDPGVNARVRTRIRSVRSAHLFEPLPGWLLGITPLPGCTPLRQVRGHPECFFAEGKDRISTDERERLCELAATAPERMAEVPGDWGFCRLASRGQALIVRSCGGKVPFYVWNAEHTRGFSTLIGDVVRWRFEEPTLDPLVNAIMLSWLPTAPDDRSLLSDVQLVRRGHFAVVNGENCPRQTCYWDPRDREAPRPLGRVPNEIAQAYRADILETLKRELKPEGHHLATLSGGVDSSSLVYLAARTLGRRVSTISFVPSTEATRQREIDYIDRVTRPLRIAPSFRLQMDPASRIALIRNSPPIATHMMNPGLGSLRRVTQCGSFSAFFGGEYADGLCGSARTMVNWRRNVPLSRMLHFRELPLGPKEPLRWLRHRAWELLGREPTIRAPLLPAVVRPDLNDEYAEWRAREQARVVADHGPWRWMHALLVERDYPLAMNWEVASWHGLSRVTPFMTRGSIELAYSVHPDDVIGPGTKRLLRRALLDDVPVRNLYRPDNGGWGRRNDPPSEPWRAAVPDALAGIIRSDWLPCPPALLPWEAVARLWQITKFADAVRTIRRSVRASDTCHVSSGRETLGEGAL